MSGTSETQPARQRELTVTQLAGLLEYRLHWPHLNADEFVAGCQYAAKTGLAAVLCRPEQVPEASQVLADAKTKIVTVLDHHDANGHPHDLDALTDQALALTDQGVDELGLAAAPGRVTTQQLMEQLEAVRDAVDPAGVTLRVLMDCHNRPLPEISALSTHLGVAGVAMVQCGTTHPDPPSFECVQAMRDALPQWVLLKWSQEMKSLAALLVCISMGLDRFNTDPKKLLQAAKRSAALGPLVVLQPFAL